MIFLLLISEVISDNAMSRGRGRVAASRVFVCAAKSQLKCRGVAPASAQRPNRLGFTTVLFIYGDLYKSKFLSESIRLIRNSLQNS